MDKKNIIYLIGQEELEENILFNYIYPNEKSNYYLSDDFSKDFYIKLAFYGFITTSFSLKNKFYLLPEIQFEYSILDFANMHISKKVKKLLNKNEFKFCINENFELVLNNLDNYHKNNWLKKEYKSFLTSSFEAPNMNINNILNF